jgi:head-tail adaptor
MIGGNIKAVIQTKTTTRNAIGEDVVSWQDAQELKGFLDLANGDYRYNNYHAKVQESTHVFIADYVPLQGVTAENCRMLVDELPYDVTLIDDPMGLHRHWEIYLRFTGGL